MPPAPGLYNVLNHEKNCIKSKRFLFNLQQMGKVRRPFCWHQNFVLWGLSIPVLGLYTCIKSWKKCIKSDLKEIFFKLATNEWSDKTFVLTSKLCPLGAVCSCPGAIYMYKIMKKKCIQSKSSKIFLLKQMTYVTRGFCWHQNFVPRGCLRLYTFIKSWKDVCKVRGWRDSF